MTGMPPSRRICTSSRIKEGVATKASVFIGMSVVCEARVDSEEVRNWIKSQIDQRFPF